jgi:DNA-binding NtrC family response regulator
MSRTKEDLTMPNDITVAAHKRLPAAPFASAFKKRVLVFSPDADLARFLLLNIEDRFQIIRECRLENFEYNINEISPDLVLIDLFTFSADILKQLDILNRTAASIPIIALRAYMSLTPEINKLIDELTDIVFYKPVDIELVTQAIEDLLVSSIRNRNVSI